MTSQTERDHATSRLPSYVRIRDTLRERIVSGHIAQGLVLLEGPIAELFGTSRGPVRKALQLLHEEGVIRRFEGRGYLVAAEGQDIEPVRSELTSDVLGFHIDEPVSPRPYADSIFAEVEEAVATCIAFGHYRLIETTLCEYHDVSRTVGREVLQRLREQELIEKSSQSHWLAGPITATAVAQEYELRLLLEPAALVESAPKMQRRQLEHMHQRLEHFIQVPEDRTIAAIQEVEHALHHECLKLSSNRKLLRILAHCRLPLAVSRIFYSTLGNSRQQPLFHEHKLVVDHLLAGSFDAAAGALEAHLRASARRSKARLKVLSVFPEPELPPYLVKIV